MGVSACLNESARLLKYEGSKPIQNLRKKETHEINEIELCRPQGVAENGLQRLNQKKGIIR